MMTKWLWWIWDFLSNDNFMMSHQYVVPRYIIESYQRGWKSRKSQVTACQKSNGKSLFNYSNIKSLLVRYWQWSKNYMSFTAQTAFKSWEQQHLITDNNVRGREVCTLNNNKKFSLNKCINYSLRAREKYFRLFSVWT